MSQPFQHSHGDLPLFRFAIQTEQDLKDALDSAGLDIRVEEAPWVLTMPARVLSIVAGGNVRKLRADRLAAAAVSSGHRPGAV